MLLIPLRLQHKSYQNEGFRSDLKASHTVRSRCGYWSGEAQVPWLYDAERRIWISYDDPLSIARKTMYARAHGLAGIMIWDPFADDGSLLLAALRILPARRSE